MNTSERRINGCLQILRELAFRCQVQCGGDDDGVSDWDKVPDGKLVGNVEYGATVRIEWDGAPEGGCSEGECPGDYDFEDHGYVMGLPWETDPDLGAIVHVPTPTSDDKGEAGPEWMTLLDLLLNERVKRVHVGEPSGDTE